MISISLVGIWGEKNSIAQAKRVQSDLFIAAHKHSFERFSGANPVTDIGDLDPCKSLFPTPQPLSN